MKLHKVRVREFRSIRDSEELLIDDITCLVGKNESGKTALLQALYKLNPVIEKDSYYDVTDDYPRKDVEDYNFEVEDGEREPAIVCTATFHFEDDDLAVVTDEFGENVLKLNELIIEKGYANKDLFHLQIDEKKVVKALLNLAQMPSELTKEYAPLCSLEELQKKLEDAEESEHLKRVKSKLAEINKAGGIEKFIYDLIAEDIPRFLYFDEYFQMRGHANIDALQQRQAQNALKDHDRPLLGLIELARLDFDQLLNPQRTQNLKNKLEGAGNHLSKKTLKYWSQNKNLSIRFDVRPAQREDPEGMRTGVNIWAEIYDNRHLATTPLGRRSRGFVWFFSFLAYFEQQKKKKNPLILLLDEPGLSLHATAQADLLRYIEKELRNDHQIIYTTHSPFMVDPNHFERVRIVQDQGIDIEDDLPEEKDGTKVFSDVLLANDDTLFPLQGALGYELHQTLFIGPNSLLVEGVSDILYLQTISGLLSRQERTSLSERWTITPIGGAGRLPLFAALMGSQQNMRIATLLDIDKGNRQMLDNLIKQRILQKKKAFTYGDFTDQQEADIEDMFDREFYIKLVQQEFAKELGGELSVDNLGKQPRILKALPKALKSAGFDVDRFNHYRPARYLSEHIATLEKEVSEDTLSRFEVIFQALNGVL